MGVQNSILKPLHSSDGERDGFVNNKEVAHVSVAGGLAGRMRHAADHVEPIGRGKQVRLNVPTPATDPRPFKRFDADGSLLEDVQVGFGKSRAIFEVTIENENATFTYPVDP